MHDINAALRLGRRATMLGAAAGLLGSFAARAQQATPELVDAANKEGAVAFYTSIDVAVAEKMTAAFSKMYPKIHLQVERSGAERILQRLMQEYGSNIHTADVVESSDITSFVDWKQRGWMAEFVPEDVGKYWPKDQRDPDGTFATVRAHCPVIGYNTKQVKAADAPTSFADLLNPKWRMRMVKAHPSYSGTIVTSTYCLVQAPGLGWDYISKLAKQQVLQVQSSTEPPKKVDQGERSVMVDGNEYNAFFMRDNNEPIEIVYAAEGTPLVPGQAGVLKAAPHPNAARLFANFLFSQECQQLMIDAGGLRSFHPKTVLKADRKPLSDIKLLPADPTDLAKATAEIKRRYAEIFGV
jgi:iron(III) transport system substrate-binding protein